MESVLLGQRVLSSAAWSKPQRVAAADFAHLVNQEAARDAPGSRSGGATENMRPKKSRRLLLRLWFSTVLFSFSLLLLSNVSTAAVAPWSAASTSSNDLLSDTDSGESEFAARNPTHVSLEKASMGKSSTRARPEQPTSSSVDWSDFPEAGAAAGNVSSVQDNTNNNNNIKLTSEGRTDSYSKGPHAFTAGRAAMTRPKAKWLGSSLKESWNPTPGPHTDFLVSSSSSAFAVSGSAGMTRSEGASRHVADEGGGAEEAVSLFGDVPVDQFRTAAGTVQSHAFPEGSALTVSLNAKSSQNNSPRAARGRGLLGMHLRSRSHEWPQNVSVVAKRSQSFPRYHKDPEECSYSSTCSSTSLSSTVSAGVSKFKLRRTASRVKKSGSAAALPRKGEDSSSKAPVATDSMEPIEGAAPARELVGTQTQQSTAGVYNVSKKSPEGADSPPKSPAAHFDPPQSADVRQEGRTRGGAQIESEQTAVQKSPSTKYSNQGTRIPNPYFQDQERVKKECALQRFGVSGRVALPDSNAAANAPYALGTAPKPLRDSHKNDEFLLEKGRECGDGAMSSERQVSATQGATSLHKVHRGSTFKAPWKHRREEQAMLPPSFQERPENFPSDGSHKNRGFQHQRQQREHVRPQEEWMALRFHLMELQQEAEKIVQSRTGVAAGRAAAQSIPPLVSRQHQQHHIVRPKLSPDPLKRSKQSKKKHKLANQSGTSPPKENTLHPKNKSLLRSFAMGHQRLKEGVSDFLNRAPTGVYFSIPCCCGSVHSSRLDSVHSSRLDSTTPTPQAGCHGGLEGCQNISPERQAQQGGVPAEADEAGAVSLTKTVNAREDPNRGGSTSAKTKYSSEVPSRRESTTSTSSLMSEPAVSVWGPRPSPFLFDVVSFKNKHNYDTLTETERYQLDKLVQQLLRVELWLASLPDEVTLEQPRSLDAR